MNDLADRRDFLKLQHFASFFRGQEVPFLLQFQKLCVREVFSDKQLSNTLLYLVVGFPRLDQVIFVTTREEAKREEGGE